MSLIIPTVTESTPRGERLVDLYSRLLGARIVFLGTPIDDTVANLVIAQLLHLEADHPHRDVQLYINSPGGDMTALFAIYDTMQLMRPDVVTVCVARPARPPPCCWPPAPRASATCCPTPGCSSTSPTAE